MFMMFISIFNVFVSCHLIGWFVTNLNYSMDKNLPLTIFPSERLNNNSEEYGNWTAVPSPSDLVKTEEEDYNEEIVRLIQVVGRSPIIVLGTIGNLVLLTFFTMQRGSLKEQSTCFYMAILALADIGEVLLILSNKSKDFNALR